MWNEDYYSEIPPGYFYTFNTVDWVDIFIRPMYKQVIVHTLNHFIESKGLIVYSWCLMTNHLLLLARAQPGYTMEEIEKKYKCFTTQKVLEAIETEPDARKEWMLKRFENFGDIDLPLTEYNIWQEHTKAGHVNMNKPATLIEYFEYIHENPVRDRIVESAADYLYSSARDYAGIKGLVNIQKLPAIEQQLGVSESFNHSFFVKHFRN